MICMTSKYVKSVYRLYRVVRKNWDKLSFISFQRRWNVRLWIFSYTLFFSRIIKTMELYRIAAIVPMFLEHLPRRE